MKNEKQEQVREDTDFISLIMEMRNGAVAVDLNRKFNEVLGAVIDTGSAGELQVTFKIETEKMGLGGIVLEVATEHKTKMKKPELAVGSARFFVTQTGRLSRNDPRQDEMFNASEEIKQ